MLRVVDPDVGHRQRQVLGERPGPIDADALGVLAQVPPAGQAVAAAAADHVPLAADDLADVEVLDVRADLDDLADELVADHHRHRDRLLRPGVPGLDVHVGAADPGAQHLDQHVVDADPRAPAPRRATGRAWPLSSRGPASSPSADFLPFVEHRLRIAHAGLLGYAHAPLKANFARRKLAMPKGTVELL